MNAEFNWWLLIVGLVIGAGLVWLVLLDSRRREEEVTAAERATEADWLARTLAEEGTTLPPTVAERVLDLHALYLATTMAPEPAIVREPVPERSSQPVSEPAAVATPADPATEIDRAP